MSKPSQRCASALAILALLACAAAWWSGETRFRALAYRPDFGFYHQFAARAGLAELGDRQTFNVQGNNMFGIVGREGQDHLHQAIHLEPIKYLDVLGFRLGAGPRWMFLWRSLLHALPLLFLLRASLASELASERKILLLLLGLAYVAFPSFLYHATFDLRPYQILAPALFCLFLAVVVELPGPWVFGALALALFAREEALLLAGFGVVLLQLLTPERRSLVKATCSLWLAWLALTLGYMAWTGYSLQRSLPGSIVFAGAAVAALAAPLVAGLRFPRIAQAMALAAPGGIVTLSLLRDRWDHNLGWFYAFLHPRPFVVVPTVLVAILWLADSWPRAAQRTAVALVLASLGIHAVSQQAPLWQFGWQAERGQAAELVFGTKDTLDPLRSKVLCDASTCQAFADFEHSFHYNGLFGDSGFPDRGPAEASIPEWLREFDGVAVTAAVASLLEPYGLTEEAGWSLERSGPFVVARLVPDGSGDTEAAGEVGAEDPGAEPSAAPGP
ncbi:MAG: hypothetical protein AAGK22_07730 [Acidobacteriota bacterium]